jgi:NADH-quinone oxidoreductase subunit E
MNLTAPARNEIEKVIEHHPDTRSACVEVLNIVQRHQGWVSDACLEEAAGMLGMSPAELEGVATFYNMIFRKPVGRHVILVCESISCWMVGKESVLTFLKKKLGVEPGGTTEDGRFTLLCEPCLGACDQAPAMMVDGDLHGDLDEQKIEAVLDKYA